MIYGLYLSAQGAQTQSMRLNVIANNLANASTDSFKRDLVIFQAEKPFDEENGIADDLPGDVNQSTGGVSAAGVVTDFSDGRVLKTGNSFDIALSGPGFLRVTDGQHQFLTRNGKLALNDNGELVTRDTGHGVLGSQGTAIRGLFNANGVEITSDGSIFQINENGTRTSVARLDLVTPESLDELVKVGNSLYRTQGSVLPAGPEVKVRQGFVELSGTQSVLEMMQLIEASRAFEMNINMMKFQDEALGQLLQTVPRR